MYFCLVRKNSFEASTGTFAKLPTAGWLPKHKVQLISQLISACCTSVTQKKINIKDFLNKLWYILCKIIIL